jgi:hypothetical protein
VDAEATRDEIPSEAPRGNGAGAPPPEPPHGNGASAALGPDDSSVESNGDEADAAPGPDPPPEPEPPPKSDGHGRAEDAEARGNYRFSEPPEGGPKKPYGPTRAHLLGSGYQLERTFDYALPGGRVLYREDRYVLRPGLTPSKERTRKTCRFWHVVDGRDFNGTGPRDERIIYGWQAILETDPAACVHITEGAYKASALIAKGLLATAVAYHRWNDRCINALRGTHLIYHEDHDLPDANGIRHAKTFSADARTKLAPVAASFRIVPALHLWKNLGLAAAPPHGWDVKDWLDDGGDATTLEALCREIPAEGTELDAWDAGELLCAGPPKPRQWLTSRQFCRGFLSGLVAPGDAGKTTLRLTQAIELAAYREILGHRIYRRCRVLVVSFEDDRDELHRRLQAICQHHRIDPRELKEWLFCRELSDVKLAESVKGKRQAGPLDAMLRKAIARLRPDLVILDPFVKLHALDENANPDMDFVCTRLIKLAQDFNIAVDSPAHTHKGAIAPGDADARRGASAQRDAGRLDYTLTVMSEEEARRFGIDPDERKSYVRLDRAKANLVRAIKAQWFRLASVSLGNATELYPDGDEIQAIETWTPPDTWAGLDPEMLNAALDAIDAGMPNGQRYSAANAAKGRAAWPIVQQHCPGKTEAQCREIIRAWLKTGVLYEDTYDDPVQRRELSGLCVDDGKRPD